MGILQQENQQRNYFWPKVYEGAKTVQSQKISEKNLLGMRIVFFLYVFIINIIQHVRQDGESLKYLTNQSGFTVLLYFLFSVIDGILYQKNNGKLHGEKLWKFTHVAYELAWAVQLPVVLMYWGVIADKFTFINFSVHGGFCILMFVEFYLSDIEIVKSHWVILTIYSVIALIINFIVTVAVEEVYDVITYTNVGSYIYIVLILVLIYLTFFGGYYLQYKFKFSKSDEQISEEKDVEMGKVSQNNNDNNNQQDKQQLTNHE